MKVLQVISLPKVDVIFDCLNRAERAFNRNYDVVVDLDITSPLRTVEDIKNAIEKISRNEVDVVYSVAPSRRNPYFNMVKEENSFFCKLFLHVLQHVRRLLSLTI